MPSIFVLKQEEKIHVGLVWLLLGGSSPEPSATEPLVSTLNQPCVLKRNTRSITLCHLEHYEVMALLDCCFIIVLWSVVAGSCPSQFAPEPSLPTHEHEWGGGGYNHLVKQQVIIKL